MFDMAPNAFLTKIVTLINWLPECLTWQSRKRLRSLHVVTWNSADGFARMTLRSRLLESRQHSMTTARKQTNLLNCYYPTMAHSEHYMAVDEKHDSNQAAISHPAIFRSRLGRVVNFSISRTDPKLRKALSGQFSVVQLTFCCGFSVAH
jgi:hypothetical protein